MSCILFKTFVKRFVIFIFCCELGVIMFYFIEKDYSENFIANRQIFHANLTSKLKTQYNMSSKEVEMLFEEFEEAFRDSGMKWDLLNAQYFVIQLVTTIGYGNITPKTTAGRLLCIPVALIGIPIAALLFQTIGKMISQHQKTILCVFERKILKRSGPIKHQSFKAVVFTSFAASTFFLLGAVQYSYQHGPQTFTDGIYVWVMTLTTVGFGDLVAISPVASDPLSVFKPVLILLGLCVVSTALNNVSDCMKGENTLWCALYYGKCGKAKVENKTSEKDTALSNDVSSHAKEGHINENMFQGASCCEKCGKACKSRGQDL